MHEIHDGPDFRLRECYGISDTSVGQRLMFVFSWAHYGSIGGWFSLALTLGELRTNFFVSWQYVYIFDLLSSILKIPTVSTISRALL